MKKYRDDDYWFELTEGPGPTGLGFVRYFRVTCRKCGKQAKHLANGQSNDQLRKFFIRQNWDIGRATNLHFCPDCATRNKHRPTESLPEPAASNVFPLHPPQGISLQEAWDQANDAERTNFWNYLQLICREHGEQLRCIPVVQDDKALQASMIPDVKDDDEPDEPADWWLDLQNQKEK